MGTVQGCVSRSLLNATSFVNYILSRTLTFQRVSQNVNSYGYTLLWTTLIAYLIDVPTATLCTLLHLNMLSNM